MPPWRRRARRTRWSIIGYDGQPEGLRAIAEGKIYADPIQFPDKIGHLTVATIDRYFAGEDVPKEQLIPTSLYRREDALQAVSELMTDGPPLLEMRGIARAFPGVQALEGVDLTLRGGEVLALLGENGAGKSTLMKILGGALLPDAGTIRISGQDAAIRDPIDARRAGVALIYQEFNLIPALSARENIFLGREQTRTGFLRRGDERTRARQLFERIGIAVDPEVPCGRLSVAQQQAVEIAKALALDARILVMDEPSATLTPQEVEALFRVIRDLTRQGLGVIYISHRLEEVFQIADRAMVLRDGRHVATRPRAELSRSQLIEWMVGRPLTEEYPKRSVAIGEPRLVVEGLSRGDKVQDVSFAVRRGEIVALAGLVGSGRTETVRLLFGADRPDAGRIAIDGRPLRIRHPRDAIRAGLGLLTEDRKAQGLVLSEPVLHNFALPSLPEPGNGGVPPSSPGARRRSTATPVRCGSSSPIQASRPASSRVATSRRSSSPSGSRRGPRS